MSDVDTFKYTDQDGDRIVVSDLGDVDGDSAALAVLVGGDPAHTCIAYLPVDKAAELRDFLDAFVKHERAPGDVEEPEGIAAQVARIEGVLDDALGVARDALSRVEGRQRQGTVRPPR